MTREDVEKGTLDHARYDLADYINYTTPDNEHDPYGHVMTVIRVVLEWGLDDGINTQMSKSEFHNLEAIAYLIGELDPASAPDPRAG